MTHLSKEELRRGREAGRAELRRMASHLSICPSCRALAADFLSEGVTPAKREVPIKALVELAKFDRDTAIEHLLARAEFVELRRLTRAAQKERVIQSRSCHTWAFLEVLLADLRSPTTRDESEFLSGLAILAVQGMDAKKDSAAFKNDVLATIWIETANARRKSAEWNHAEAALLRAEKHLESGTGDPLIKARWLSISASLYTDQGGRAEAMVLLEECRKIYEHLNDWPLVARTLVKMAHASVDVEPERGLALLGEADLFIPPDDAELKWLSESIRTECLITLGRLDEALRSFEEVELFRASIHRLGAGRRNTFTAARLLEALGRVREAETLFDEVVTSDLEQGFYKDAFLDLLYLFGFHVRQAARDRAVHVSLQTLDELERRTSVHEQLRSVWAQLIDAARRESLDERTLAEARDYLRAHWKYPASAEPILATREGLSIAPAPIRVEVEAEEGRFEPLLARALWSQIRRETRRSQQDRVARSPECHTRAFLEVLLAELRAAGSRDEAEFIASLTLAAVQGLDEPHALKNDLRAQVWTEVANARRIGAEWSRAAAALRRADGHLAEGTGDPLLRGRVLSVTGSLRADQGHRSEAVALLERCEELYAVLKERSLAARTLIKMANILVDIDPGRGLALIAKATPMIPAADSVLRWLAESIRTECLIELGEVGQALQAFQVAESLRGNQPRPDATRRNNFSAARLLEALGLSKDAERLFEGVIADALEHESYREAFLDLLYLFGFHIRMGSTEKAVALCNFAVAELERFDVAHEQLRTVWVELLDAARREEINLRSLSEARAYLEAHWTYPAAKPPRFSFGTR